MILKYDQLNRIRTLYPEDWVKSRIYGGDVERFNLQSERIKTLTGKEASANSELISRFIDITPHFFLA